VCRYYGNPAYGLESHFYSASPDECADVQRRWPDQWRLESLEVFRVDLPDPATGMCVPGSMPVYRALNGRADTNHRYTADARIQASMIGRGYTPEGVAMCSPL
jgi:serine protease